MPFPKKCRYIQSRPILFCSRIVPLLPNLTVKRIIGMNQDLCVSLDPLVKLFVRRWSLINVNLM